MRNYIILNSPKLIFMASNNKQKKTGVKKPVTKKMPAKKTITASRASAIKIKTSKVISKAGKITVQAKNTNPKMSNKAALESARKKKPNISVPQPDEVKNALNGLLSNERAVEYLKKNVSKMAVDVIGMLVTPKTDEFLAEQMGTKINAIRRILNIMQGYGITNYYISKNTKGWLSFAWYINTSKLQPFLEYVDGMEREKSIIDETCNDYFICGVCYKSDRYIFTFDSALENSFHCNNCGKNLDRMDRSEAELLLNKAIKA
jgi:transcription factor E